MCKLASSISCNVYTKYIHTRQEAALTAVRCALINGLTLDAATLYCIVASLVAVAARLPYMYMRRTHSRLV